MSAISSASVPASPGSRFTLVIRTIGWRAKPSARMQPPERVEADLGRALARGEEAAQHALAHDRDALRRHALVVPAEGAQAAGQRGVGGHRAASHPSRSAAIRGRRRARSSCPRRRPRRRAPGRAPPRAPPTRAAGGRAARRRGSASCGPKGTAARRAALPPRGRPCRALPGEVERDHVLPAGLRHVAGVLSRGRSGPELVPPDALSPGPPPHSTTAWVQGPPSGGGKPLSVTPGPPLPSPPTATRSPPRTAPLEPPRNPPHPPSRARSWGYLVPGGGLRGFEGVKVPRWGIRVTSGPLGGEQQLQLVLERYREGVALARALPVAGRGGRPAPAGGRAAGAGPAATASARANAAQPRARDVAGGGEAPAAAVADPHADPLGLALGACSTAPLRVRPGARAATTCRASAYSQRPSTAAMRLVSSPSTEREAIAARSPSGFKEREQLGAVRRGRRHRQVRAL